MRPTGASSGSIPTELLNELRYCDLCLLSVDERMPETQRTIELYDDQVRIILIPRIHLPAQVVHENFVNVMRLARSIY